MCTHSSGEGVNGMLVTPHAASGDGHRALPWMRGAPQLCGHPVACRTFGVQGCLRVWSASGWLLLRGLDFGGTFGHKLYCVGFKHSKKKAPYRHK